MRTGWRKRLGLRPDDWVWIATCVQPTTKGTDRSVRALRHFPDARLLVVGLGEDETKSAKTRQLAQELGVADRIKWLGHHEDVPELMAAADVFVHPARYDTTGTVILEAIVNGLPVITTSNCGYAKHVTSANAGIVVQEPFRPQTFLAALGIARDPACRLRWSGSGREYGKQTSLYEGRARASELIVASGFRHAADARGRTGREALIDPRRQRRGTVKPRGAGARASISPPLRPDHRAKLALHAIANARPGCSNATNAATRSRCGACPAPSSISTSRACASLRST